MPSLLQVLLNPFLQVEAAVEHWQLELHRAGRASLVVRNEPCPVAIIVILRDTFGHCSERPKILPFPLAFEA
jgi:hypothetical protein